MTQPKVVNLHHAVLSSRELVYVGRGTPWGNQFKITRDGTREEVVAKFEKWLRSQPDMMLAVRINLRGCDLGCWCAPARCHADVLLAVANAPR